MIFAVFGLELGDARRELNKTMTTTHIKNRGSAKLNRLMGCLLLMVCVLLVGCGESVELKLEQARIAMANDRPDTALSLVDQVLSSDPTNREALLIQARAQIQQGSLGPAKLILDRLGKSGQGDPEVSAVLLAWSVGMIESALSNPDFVNSPTDLADYETARQVADEQLAFLKEQGQADSEIGFNQALLLRYDLRRARALIRHHQQRVNDLGADALIETDDDNAEGEATAETYGERLAALEADVLEIEQKLLSSLAQLVEEDPRHVDAGDLYLRMLIDEQMWDRLMDQVRAYSEVTELPVAIADQAVTVLLGMPESLMPMAERVELGWAILKQTPEAEAESAVRQVTSARLFLAGDQTEKVIPILSKLIEDGSTDPDAFYMYAQALYATEDFEKCREITAQMFPAMESVAQVQMLHGLTLWRIGEIGEARVALRKACELDPTNKVAADAFATVMAQQGFIGASGEDIEAFYKLDPTNPRAIQLKLQHAAATGDQQQTAVLLTEIEARAEHTDTELELLYMGNDLLERHNAAADWARALIERRPDELNDWKRLASTQLKQGDEAGLADTLERIAQKFPDAPDSDHLTGELYIQARQYEYAVAALGAAVEKDATNLEARISLARAMAAIGRLNTALTHVQAVLEVTPDDIEALALGSRIAYASGDAPLADEYLKQIDPTQVDQDKDPALAARVYLSHGDMETAERISTQAITAGNFSPMLRLVLAGIYQERGEAARAEEHLVALVRHFPESTEAYAWLSQFYAREGMIDEGAEKLLELEVYNQPLAMMARAGLLKSADRVDEAIAVLDPLLTKLVREQGLMAPSVADMMAVLYKEIGDEASADAVYDRLYAGPSQAVPALISDLITTWDDDSPGRRQANLDSAAARVSADDTDVIIELSRRYAMIGRPDQSLLVVQRGLSAKPDNVELLGVKAGVMVMLGRTSEAVRAYRQVLEMLPEDDVVRVRYARALAEDGRRPEAEEELMRLIRTGGASGQAARAAMLEIYQQLGLHLRVETMANALLDKVAAGEDASLDRVIGMSLVAQGRHAEAQGRLAAIPTASAYFPTAQVALAQSEAEAGDNEAALSRIAGHMSDAAVARRLAPVLLGLDMSSDLNLQLLNRADVEVDIDALPYDLALRWLALRMKLADQRGDWALAEETIQRVARIEDNDDSVVALMIVLKYRQGQSQAGADMLLQLPRLEGSATGSLLAYGLDVKATEAGRVHPMVPLLQAIVAGDRDGLAEASKAYNGVRSLFTDDLLNGLSSAGAGGDLAASCRDLAMATVAMEARMPGLGESLCESGVQKAKQNIAAHALHAAARIERGSDTAALADRVRSIAPESSLVLMLDAMGLVSAGEHAGAIEPLTTLTQRHPDNPHLVYQLAQELNVAGREEQAIAALKPISQGDGPYRLAALNDLAFLMSNRSGGDSDEAVNIARQVLRELPGSPPVLDTAGWVEHQRGRHEPALKLMARAITLMPEVPEVHYHIGSVYHALGEDRWARYHLAQAASGEAGERGVQEAAALLVELGEGPDVQ